MRAAPVEGIRLPFFTVRQRTLVAQWLVAAYQLGRSDWPEVLAAFDQLHAGTLRWQGERLTFATFHERVVEEPLGQLLLEDLVAFAAPAREGPPRLATFNRQVRERLITCVSGWEDEATRYWLAYNLFWAQSFGRGYLYEVTIYADLRATGIVFEAHDLLDPIARRSPFDVRVSGWRGDCKSSTYFLHTARSFPLRHDFYLTRWFDPGRRTWQDAAVLQPWVWAGLNGEPQATTLEKVLTVFPGAAEVTTSDGPLIVVPYELWKDRIKRFQAVRQEI